MSDRLLTFAIGITVVLVLGVLFYRIDLQKPGPSQIAEAPEVESKPVTVIKARATECRQRGKRVHLKGIVENRGATVLSSVTLQVIWKGERGVIDTSLAYVAVDNPILPGTSREFFDSTTLRGVEWCTVKALDWWAT